MKKSTKSILTILFILLLQLTIYNFFLKPIISTWGATQQEIAMPMAGDLDVPAVTTTRAILINAPKAQVWQWLIQLGADRGGFYSYTFIEEALGYKTREQDTIAPEFKQIAVGDVVRGSIDEDSSLIPYNFKVLYVEPEKSFVLEDWGTFFLEEVNDQQTDLIIRTQVPEGLTLKSKITNYIEVPLHYIMERRTLMGIKARVEAGEGVQLSEKKDVFWFIGIVFSGLLTFLLIFMGKGIIQTFVLPSIFSTLWVLVLLILNPVPLYSIGLWLILCLCIFVTNPSRLSNLGSNKDH